jgi:DNA topoisomerase-3
MKVIITEKENVASVIAGVIGNSSRVNNYYKTPDYYVCWCQGHLLSLCDPDVYEDAWAKWNLADIPMIPSVFKTSVVTRTKHLYEGIEELVKRSDVSEIICATDTGREGQLIFQLVFDRTKCKKPVKRMWYSSLEKGELYRSLHNLKDNAEYSGYYHSAFARAKADWLVGMNMTRLYTLIYGPFSSEDKVLNVGRVQTPTLAMIVKRHQDILKFKKIPYFEVIADFDKFKATWFDENGTRIESLRTTTEIVNDCKSKDALVVDIQVKKVARERPQLYYLTELQREANVKFGFSPALTLSLAQSLYDKGILTYPRTDSAYLTDDFKDGFGDMVSMIVSKYPELKPISIRLVEQGFNIDDKIINNAKVSDHHAIIVTKAFANYSISQLSSDEQRILRLVIGRILLALDKKYIYNEVKTIFKIDKHYFKSIATQVLDPGWKETSMCLFANNDEEEENNSYIKFSKGETYTPIEVKMVEKETKPEKPFTYATILTSMERAGKNITNEDLRSEMKNVSLGTEATRATILKDLVDNHYIDVKNKNLVPTERGIKLIDTMIPELTIPDLTGEWEKQLESIKNNELSEADFLKYITEFLHKIKPRFDDIKPLKKDPSSSYKNEVVGPCPICKHDVLVGKKSYYCSEYHNDKKCLFSIWITNYALANDYGIELKKSDVSSILKYGYISKTAKGVRYNIKLTVDKDKPSSFTAKKLT